MKIACVSNFKSIDILPSMTIYFDKYFEIGCSFLFWSIAIYDDKWGE